jgi:hypothetical protein
MMLAPKMACNHRENPPVKVLVLMFAQRWLHHWSNALFLLGVLLGSFFSSESFSQEAITNGVRFTRDGSGRIVGLTYFGRDGLRQSAPQDISNLIRVEISYGTTLKKEDVEFLSSLQSVEELSFGGNLDDEYVVIEGSLAPLAILKRLESVFLCKRDMSDSDLSFLAQLPNLQQLEFLAGPNPSHESGSSVTDACAESIKKAKSLRWLRIDGQSQLSDRFVDEITQRLTKLEHLVLDSEHLTDRSLQLISERCSNLRSLDLWSKHFTDKGVTYLAAATKLEDIWLEVPLLTHESVSALAELKNLRRLLMAVPSMTNDAAQKVANLPALEILCLRNTPLSDEQFAMFANHPKLESIFANGRNLTTENVLQVIATMPKLDHIELLEARDTQRAVNRLLADRKSAAKKSDR